jgi:PHP family Zn ribbon phosphoesterase
MRTIIAKYACKCDECGQSIRKGDLVVWSKAERLTVHSRCAEARGPSNVHVPDFTDIAYEDQCQAACGL